MDVINMDEYQQLAKSSAIYPRKDFAQGITYITLGLVGEAGEVANKVKKLLRDDNSVLTLERRRQLQEELGDVFWYLAMLCDELDTHLSTIAAINISKLRKRKEEQKLQGEGDNR